jgi:hypothetical protein
MADAGNAKRKIVIAMDGSQISEDALRCKYKFKFVNLTFKKHSTVDTVQ